MVLNGLTRCCTAFNTKFSDQLYEIFLDRLARFTPEQVGAAFASAIDECEHMPRLKHILARIEQPKSTNNQLDVKITGIHRESFDENFDIKVWATESGAKFVRLVSRDPFALPPKPFVPMSDADRLNFKRQMSAAAAHMKIPYSGMSDAQIEQRRQELLKQGERMKEKYDRQKTE